VDARYKNECYLKQTAYAVFVRNSDFAAVFALCEATADIDFHRFCYQGIGGDAAITSSKYVIGEQAQAATTRQLCLLGPDFEAHSNCVVGAVVTIVRDLSGDDAQARALCASIDDEHLGAVCGTTLTEARQSVPSFSADHQHHHHS
jgi:hypothetical protein